MVPWAVAAILGGATAWAGPQAGRSNDLQSRATALSEQAATAVDAATAVQATLEGLRARLADARERGEELAATHRGNAKRIERLEARVEELEAQAAAAAAAAAAASEASASSSSSSSTSSPPAVEPFTPEPVCAKQYNPSTGQWEEVC